MEVYNVNLNLAPSCFELDVVFPQQIYSVSHQLVVIWLMSSCTLQTFDTSLPLKLKPSLSRIYGKPTC